jgi:NAD(P)-dependent dehydrogenase (short-subunit alcohol dehydrogenase family)
MGARRESLGRDPTASELRAAPDRGTARARRLYGIARGSSNPFLGVYNVTKHAVVTLSETLAQELAIMGAPVRVSVLCPGFVQTQIADSQRNRPASYADSASRLRSDTLEQTIRSAIAGGLPPAEVAAHVHDAIRNERFYVFTHPDITHDRVRRRMEGILENRTPTPTGALPR